MGDTSAALRLVQHADPAAPAATARFSGCYGPGLVATWGAASGLVRVRVRGRDRGRDRDRDRDRDRVRVRARARARARVRVRVS